MYRGCCIGQHRATWNGSTTKTKQQIFRNQIIPASSSFSIILADILNLLSLIRAKTNTWQHGAREALPHTAAMPPKRKRAAITTAKPAMRAKTGSASTRTHPLNKPASEETPANNNIKKRKPERRLYQGPRPSTATADGAKHSPFMALPTELRCQIYNYLAAIVYDPVFLEPGICS